MTAAGATRRISDPAAAALSVALHAAAVVALLSLPRPAPRPVSPVDVEIVEAVRPPPRPVEREEPPPPAPEPARAPRPQRVVRAPVKLPRDAPPPPRIAPPPPSSPAPETPPEDAAPQVGISMSGGTTGMAAPSGNTMYGQLPDQAPPPGSARPYRAEGTAPGSGVTTLPKVIDARVPREEYPPAARREGREAVVRLLLVVGEDGRVADARVVADPGHGFGEAAARIARRYFRFEPARAGDEKVAVEIPFSVRFELR